jgi:hypothetical protein
MEFVRTGSSADQPTPRAANHPGVTTQPLTPATKHAALLSPLQQTTVVGTRGAPQAIVSSSAPTQGRPRRPRKLPSTDSYYVSNAGPFGVCPLGIIVHSEALLIL